MFVLSVLNDTIELVPEKLDEDVQQVLIDEIQLKYANRVIPNVGLCICFYDFEEVGDGYIHPAEGSASFRVTFRLVVFRPFVGEVLTGKVASANKDGLKRFFYDIFVPSHLLSIPSQFECEKDGNVNRWVWKPEVDGMQIDGLFELSKGHVVRFRVRSVSFTEITQSAKGVQVMTNIEEEHRTTDRAEDIVPLRRRRSSSMDLSPQDEAPPPMQILGCMNESGLGAVIWWEEAEEAV